MLPTLWLKRGQEVSALSLLRELKAEKAIIKPQNTTGEEDIRKRVIFIGGGFW